MKSRIATLDDIPSLCDLLAILFELEAEFAPERRLQEAGLRLILADPSIGEILVADQDGQVVGMASILYTVSTYLGQRVGLLEDVIMQPQVRGRGIGQALLDAALDHARRRGCARLTLLADVTNAGAIRFYERAGFSRSSMIPFRRLL